MRPSFIDSLPTYLYTVPCVRALDREIRNFRTTYRQARPFVPLPLPLLQALTPPPARPPSTMINEQIFRGHCPPPSLVPLFPGKCGCCLRIFTFLVVPCAWPIVSRSEREQKRNPRCTGRPSPLNALQKRLNLSFARGSYVC